VQSVNAELEIKPKDITLLLVELTC